MKLGTGCFAAMKPETSDVSRLWNRLLCSHGTWNLRRSRLWNLPLAAMEPGTGDVVAYGTGCFAAMETKRNERKWRKEITIILIH